MLMAHSVEGRFPILDRDLIALANSLPDSVKLRVLDEKHVLKRVGDGLVPRAVLERPKQPYRAPDAPSFFDRQAPSWVEELTCQRALEQSGMFDVEVVSALFRKGKNKQGGPLSNSDNMAVVGVLSTQLLHEQFIARFPALEPVPELRTLVER
jgi:asparagine synthase (glutamine-hydrolysing)